MRKSEPLMIDLIGLKGSFQGEPLNPVPVIAAPPLEDQLAAMQAAGFDPLDQIEPLRDLESLAMHVAYLTEFVRDLRDEIAALRRRP